MSEYGNDKQDYWALNEDGLLYYLGEHGDYEEADIVAENMGLNAIWLVDREFANSWRDSIIWPESGR